MFTLIIWLRSVGQVLHCKITRFVPFTHCILGSHSAQLTFQTNGSCVPL
jgi:hypothetical protein